jgi:16S rRNA processing protein RimM
MLGPEDWVPLAVVARPHGVRGELRLKLYNEDSNLLLTQEEVLVKLADGEAHEVSIDTARRANDAILLKLFSVDDRDRAEELRGAEICLKRGAFPALGDGEFYACDIQGARAEMLDGTLVGTVRDMIEYPAATVLVVEGDMGVIELPLTDAYVQHVDAAARLVSVVSIEGLEPSKSRA